MRLLFKVAPETVGAQGLKVAEQHELAQLLTEMSLVKIWQESPYGTEIGRQHVFLQVFGVTGTGLPNERCNIVVDRALAAALEVYEVRNIVLKHYVAGLEVTVHESFAHVFQKVFLELFKVVLQTNLVKVQAGSL